MNEMGKCVTVCVGLCGDCGTLGMEKESICPLKRATVSTQAYANRDTFETTSFLYF
jgi:hypothetical protein